MIGRFPLIPHFSITGMRKGVGCRMLKIPAPYFGPNFSSNCGLNFTRQLAGMWNFKPRIRVGISRAGAEGCGGEIP